MPTKEFKSVSVPVATYDALMKLAKVWEADLGLPMSAGKVIIRLVKLHEVSDGE